MIVACEQAGLGCQVGVSINRGGVHRELDRLDQAHDWLRALLDVEERNGLRQTMTHVYLGALYEQR